MHRYAWLHLAIIGALAVAACGDRVPTSPSLTAGASMASNRAALPETGIWASEVEGVTGEGAHYAFFVPNRWNGDVVFYAHGIIAASLPVTLPTGDSAEVIRDSLGAAGFAVAYSSFSENGYAFKDGVQRTHQLRGLFTSKFGKPRRSFLLGQSLGSQVVEALAEEKGSQYVGALATCGVVGGTRLQIDYIAHIRTLFDYFYPGVLPGNTLAFPPVTDRFEQIQVPVTQAITQNPTGLGMMVMIDQGRMDFTNQFELGGALVYALTYQALGINDVLDRTHGHSPFDNTAPYTSSMLPPAIMAGVNAGVNRYTVTPDAEAWLEHNYQPTGNLQLPMVTLHNTRDPLVPYRHEPAYQQIVAAAGRSSMLYQRALVKYGHCDTIWVGEYLDAFRALVEWVDTGVKPAP